MIVLETTFISPLEWIGTQLHALPRQAGGRAVVLVAAERQAHAIRRHLCIERGCLEDLAGVLMLSAPEFARELLVRTACVRRPGWEDLRRLRILHLFQSGALAGQLRYFNPEQLRSGHGYVDAFAHTIADLEASGLDAELSAAVAQRIALDDIGGADRLHDVVVTWKAADAERGTAAIATAASTAQLLMEAATLAAERPEVVAPFGQIFALLTVSPSAALLRLLRSLPDCRVVLHDARPQRTGTQRWRQLMGCAPNILPGSSAHACEAGRSDGCPPPEERRVCAQLPPAPPPPADSVGSFDKDGVGGEAHAGEAGSELELVQRFLFALPEVLTDPQRARSCGPDGSVDLEEYPSQEDEIEAAATWITEQITDGVPLEQIALVVPDVDAYAPRLIDRLSRLPHAQAGVPISAYVAGGLTLAASPAGKRLLAVLSAVARGLEAEATIRVLPALRRGDGDAGEGHPRLSPSRAAEIVYTGGILGGTPGDPAGVTEWMPRLIRRRDALRALVNQQAAARADGGAQPLNARDRTAAERWLRDVEPILPAIADLQALTEHVVAGVSLTTVWQEFRAFCLRRLRVPPLPPNIVSRLDERLRPMVHDAVAQEITGFSAVRVIMDLLCSERRPAARFGEPCIFIGTPSQASGLSFTAVRVLGLVEGALPHTPHDDPIVPDGLRHSIERAARELPGGADVVVPRLADHVLDDIHAVFRVITGARARLALSAPRQWIDRSEREVSGIMLEVATALGRRSDVYTDEGDVPTAARLRAMYLNAGRDARVRYAAAHPTSPRAVLESISVARSAQESIVVPADWLGGGALAVDQLRLRLGAGEQPTLSAMDGVVTGSWDETVSPGLQPHLPISASALRALLRCPHRFLLERILHLSPPTAAPSTDAIDPAVYGSLFHAVAERLYSEAGAALCRREGTLEGWVARAQAIADEEFDSLQHTYPMRDAEGIARARHRLLRQIQQLVQYEWQLPAREFLETELAFGEPNPVRLLLDSGDLYVHGKIDRIDRIGARMLAVRDLKTGRVRDFGEDPINAPRDLQIGLYVLALEASGYGGAPVGLAAYVHPSAAREPDRVFKGPDVEVLRRHTREWVGIAHQLLRAGAFPRTPNPDDCKYCPFVPACGDSATQQAAIKLNNLPAAHVLEPLARLKRQESERSS